MKKVIQILEDYVQWAAVALGVLWVAYIVMTYVINVPATTFPPDRTVLTVGAIDEYIYNHQQQDLDSAMNDPKPVDWPVSSAVSGPDLLKPQTAAPVSYAWMMAPSQDVVNGGVGVAVGRPNQQKGVVTKLPALPPVALAAPVSGRSQLDIPGLTKPDVDWVVVNGTIPTAKIADAWTNAFGGTQLQILNTYFLQAVLIRQEKLPNGQWGPDVAAPMLAGQTPANPLPAFPADGNVPAELDYRAQIQNQNLAITNPPTYKVLHGDPWPAPAGGAPAPAPQPPAGTPPAGAPPAGAAQPSIPPGPFLPAANMPDIPVCLHDESAKPRYTYRYKIVYRLYNPAFQLNANIAAPNVATQFSLVSPASEWSKEVTIQARTYAFIKSLKPAGKDMVSADFDVITWTSGVIHLHSCQVLVGDEIRDADFVTGLTLIDANSANGTVLVANDSDGSVTARDIASDTKDPQYASLKAKAIAAQAGGGN